MLKTIDTFKHEPIYIGNYSLVDIATMLRQQQAEIEALKQIIDANNLNQNIGQFVKPTNKPVAWMDYLEHSDVYDLNVSGRGIPLYTHPVKEEHFEDEPQAEELHEIMQSNTHPVKEQDESFDRTASHMVGEYVSYQKELTDELNNLKKENKFFKEILSEMDKQVYNIEFLKQPMQILENGQIVPLFKELTDEEIISEWVGCERNYYNFARAILLKAQEK